DPIVELLDPEAVLFEAEVAVVRVLLDLGVVERSQPVVGAHDGTEVLESGAPQRRVVSEEKVAAPVALARDGGVGLPIDGEEQASVARGLWYPAHHDEHMSVRIRVDGAGAQRLAAEAGWIEVGPIVVTLRAARAGLHGGSDVPG